MSLECGAKYDRTIGTRVARSRAASHLGRSMRKTALIATVLILLQISLVALVLVQQGTWGGPDTDEAAGVAVAADGSVYVIGTTLSFGAGGRDAFLLKYASNGNLVWQRSMDVPDNTEMVGLHHRPVWGRQSVSREVRFQRHPDLAEDLWERGVFEGRGGRE